MSKNIRALTREEVGMTERNLKTQKEILNYLEYQLEHKTLLLEGVDSLKYKCLVDEQNKKINLQKNLDQEKDIKLKLFWGNQIKESELSINKGISLNALELTQKYKSEIIEIKNRILEAKKIIEVGEDQIKNGVVTAKGLKTKGKEE